MHGRIQTVDRFFERFDGPNRLQILRERVLLNGAKRAAHVADRGAGDIDNGDGILGARLAADVDGAEVGELIARDVESQSARGNVVHGNAHRLMGIGADLEDEGIVVGADRKSTRLNSSHGMSSRMPSSA